MTEEKTTKPEKKAEELKAAEKSEEKTDAPKAGAPLFSAIEKMLNEMSKEGEKENAHRDQHEAKITELETLLKRMQADFENYRKQVEREKSEMALRYTAATVQKLLPALDELELALKHANSTASKEELEKGIKMLHNNMAKTFHAEGLKEIDALHQKFDPFLHEAIRYEESDVEEGKVSQVLKKGYLFKDRVLRHALVTVSSGKKKGKEEGK